jgi:hypothetical protein
MPGKVVPRGHHIVVRPLVLHERGVHSIPIMTVFQVNMFFDDGTVLLDLVSIKGLPTLWR